MPLFRSNEHYYIANYIGVHRLAQILVYVISILDFSEVTVQNNDSSTYRCGDLALLQNMAQTFLEEVKSLLFMQYCMKTNQIELDFNDEIDIRLFAISKLTHLIVAQAPATFPQKIQEDNFADKADSKEVLTQLVELNANAEQNLALMVSMHRFIKSKAVKQELASLLNDMQRSQEQLREKALWLAEFVPEKTQ